MSMEEDVGQFVFFLISFFLLLVYLRIWNLQVHFDRNHMYVDTQTTYLWMKCPLSMPISKKKSKYDKHPILLLASEFITTCFLRFSLHHHPLPPSAHLTSICMCPFSIVAPQSTCGKSTTRFLAAIITNVFIYFLIMKYYTHVCFPLTFSSHTLLLTHHTQDNNFTPSPSRRNFENVHYKPTFKPMIGPLAYR